MSWVDSVEHDAMVNVIAAARVLLGILDDRSATTTEVRAQMEQLRSALNNLARQRQ